VRAAAQAAARAARIEAAWVVGSHRIRQQVPDAAAGAIWRGEEAFLGAMRPYLGPEVDAVDQAAVAGELPTWQLRWAYAGNLGPSRRLDLAIEAAELLGIDFQLLIIGDGGARGRLRELAAELPRGTVELPGLMAAERAAA